MADPSGDHGREPSRPPDEDGSDQGDEPPTGEVTEEEEVPEPADLSTEELRASVEKRYDFENFGPREMERMSVEEWEAVFDPETWITGTELLDRVEADLKARVVQRDVFARVERLGSPDRVVAYSDVGYAVVYPDGSIEGEGTVLRDVKPTVALASMHDYEVPDAPDGDLLPDPVDVQQGSGEFGNLMVQAIAGAQVIAGVVLLGATVFTDLGILGVVVGLVFLVVGGLLFFTVANARLSDRFRAEEYRNRLRAVGLEDGERPDFLPESARETETGTGGRGDGDHTGSRGDGEPAVESDGEPTG